MDENQKNYVVILFDNAFDQLGDIVSPYVSEVEIGRAIFCQRVEHESMFTTLTVRPDQISPPISTTLEIQIPSEFVKFVAFADVQDHYLIGFDKNCASNDSMVKHKPSIVNTPCS